MGLRHPVNLTASLLFLYGVDETMMSALGVVPGQLLRERGPPVKYLQVFFLCRPSFGNISCFNYVFQDSFFFNDVFCLHSAGSLTCFFALPYRGFSRSKEQYKSQQ